MKVELITGTRSSAGGKHITLESFLYAFGGTG